MLQFIHDAASSEAATTCSEADLNGDVLLWCGMTYLEAGQTDEALLYLKEAHDVSPSAVNSYWYAKALENSGEYGQALVLFNQSGLSAYWPSELELGDSELEELSTEIVESDISADAHYQMAQLVFPVNQTLGQKHFDKATVGLDDQTKFGRTVDIGWFLINQNDAQNAAQWADKAQEIRPNDQYPHELKAAICRKNGDKKCEIAELEQAIGFATIPSLAARPQSQLGAIYVQLGEVDQALPLLDEAVEHHPQPCWAIYWSFEAYAQTNSCSLARQHYTKLIEMCQDSPALPLADTTKENLDLVCVNN